MINHHATISMSLTRESESGEDRMESTCDRCGDDKMVDEDKIGSPIQLEISEWWCK